ncbi:unannotated protein [freshwater metagenome]|uniref:Unannotated protein n=1 Tax=freshwater metagenome TaxID=449393 RepID=A0A6J7PDP1_9ZZZZ|nr:DUF3090 family protein [Actinomycetota bacterium]
MARIVYEFDPVERFIAGTVGQPGERTFFLQASSGSKLVSVALEKMQVGAITDRVIEILQQVARNDYALAKHRTADDIAPLSQPILEEFRVGVIGIVWESKKERLLLELQAMGDNENEFDDLVLEDIDSAPDIMRVLLTTKQAIEFVLRSRSVISAGRAPCPFCGAPLDPQGHLCPRANGYRR